MRRIQGCGQHYGESCGESKTFSFSLGLEVIEVGYSMKAMKCKWAISKFTVSELLSPLFLQSHDSSFHYGLDEKAVNLP
jgi:hypothetical protein